MANTHPERETKFDVPEGFHLPDMTALRPGLDIVASTDSLESTYFDTSERLLLRNHVTLRRRIGEADQGWQLKIPQDAARLEITLPLDSTGDAATVPDRLRGLMRGATLDMPLAPAAILRTERHTIRLTDGDSVLAEVADDSVHAAATGAAARLSEWREVEIELVDGDEDDMASLGRLLSRAGATPSAWSSKLARALDHQESRPDRATGPADLLRSYVQPQVAALVAGDVSLRRGLDPVHKTRVAARRLRSVMRVFGDVMSSPDGQTVDAELSWWQDLLGEVRDRQVQQQRFAEILSGLPEELTLGPVAGDLESTLVAERVTALAAVRAALDSERYLSMLRLATEVAQCPQLAAGATTADLVAAADKARRKAAKRLAAGRASGQASDLHRARKAVKRSRYGTELVAPAATKKAAKRIIKQHKRVQDALGEHQDSVLAAEYLLRLGRAAATRADRNGFTYGLLWSREEEHRRRLRDRIRRLKL